jgi:hypothetical protein
MDYFSSIISATVLQMQRSCLSFERRRRERFGTIRRKFFDHICRQGTLLHYSTMLASSVQWMDSSYVDG